MAADMVRAGLLDPDDIRIVSERNILTRAIGTAPGVEVDVVSTDLVAGDRFLLCSDGLWGAVSEQELQRELNEGSAEDTAHRLVILANEHGGFDNATAVVIDVQPGDVVSG
jgi:protein phosphatase